jgi:hypothetical protein
MVAVGNRKGAEAMAENVSEVFVPVEVLAREQETTAAEVVERIQNGALIGRKQSDGWHVMVCAPAPSNSLLDAAGPARSAPVKDASRQGAASQHPTAQGAQPQSDQEARPAGPQRLVPTDGVAEVVVRDVQIRFSAMVVLLLKFVLACIPVGLILGGLGFAGLWLYEKFGV